MNLSKLPKVIGKSRKRVGRGYGSAKGGHTSSRGQKGQRSRNSVPLWFEGGQLPQIRRFPFIRGKGRFTSLGTDVIEVNLHQLSEFKANDQINPNTLVKAGIVKEKELRSRRIKLLGQGEITVPLQVEVDTSTQARKKIEAAGGNVEAGQRT